MLASKYLHEMIPSVQQPSSPSVPQLTGGVPWVYTLAFSPQSSRDGAKSVVLPTPDAVGKVWLCFLWRVEKEDGPGLTLTRWVSVPAVQLWVIRGPYVSGHRCEVMFPLSTATLFTTQFSAI